MAVVLADGPTSRRLVDATLGSARSNLNWPMNDWVEAVDRHAFKQLIDQHRPSLAILARGIPLASPSEVDRLPTEFPNTTLCNCSALGVRAKGVPAK